MLKKITLSLAAATAALTALPAAANAGSYDRGRYYDGGRYEQSYRGDRYYGRGYQQPYYGDRYYGRSQRSYYNGGRRCSGTTGTIVGGAAGALLGREIGGRRDRTTGTILGGVAGALLGRQVGKSSCRR